MTQLRIGLLIVMSFVLAGSASAQGLHGTGDDTLSEYPKTAILVDEFGRASGCDLSARVDNLFNQLHNNSESTAHVIVYSPIDLLPSQLDRNPMMERIKSSISFRGFDTARFTMVDGGFRPEVGVQMFLLPPGAATPEPTDTVPRPETPAGTHLWGRSSILWGDEEYSEALDEFVLPWVQARLAEEQRLADLELSHNDNYAEVTGTSDAETTDTADDETQLTAEELEEQRFSWMDGRFATLLAADPTATGVIIVYADDQHYDTAALLQFVELARGRIAAAADIDPGKITVIFGGYGDHPHAEYHFIPQDGTYPEPTPDERPVEDEETTGEL